MKNHVYVSEVFRSVSGEVGLFRQGEWVTFVRLAGCNLRCRWCDTVRAQRQSSGRRMTIAQVCREVQRHRLPHVVLTGGEPLAQPGSNPLIAALMGMAQVQVETNGTIAPTATASCYVLDAKPPSSGVPNKSWMQWDIIARFTSRYSICPAWVKIVVHTLADYQWAKRWLDIGPGHHLVNMGIQPALSATPQFGHARLYALMRRQGRREALNVQIHKVTKLKESRNV